MEELAEVIKKCARSRLQRIDLSSNRIGVKGVLNLLQALRANMHLKVTHLNLDKANLVDGTMQEQVHNYYSMLRVLAEYIRVSKNLRSLSLNGCQLGNEAAASLAKGLTVNTTLESLFLRGNNLAEVDEEGPSLGFDELVSSIEGNKCLRLKVLDLSSNKITVVLVILNG